MSVIENMNVGKNLSSNALYALKKYKQKFKALSHCEAEKFKWDHSYVQEAAVRCVRCGKVFKQQRHLQRHLSKNCGIIFGRSIKSGKKKSKFRVKSTQELKKPILRNQSSENSRSLEEH